MKILVQMCCLSLLLLIGFTSCEKDETTLAEMDRIVADDAEVPQQRSCSATEELERRLLEDPAAAERRAQIEAHTARYLQSDKGSRNQGLITIPVVVHVVYKTNAQNISAAQINSQLEVLNDDFRRLNADASNTPAAFAGVAADTQIEFCLATVDPDGNPTDGITRRQTSVNSFSANNDNIKYFSQGGQNAWDSDNYLNMWVGNLSGGVLGYATFPGTAPASEDGVVCLYSAFGTNGSAQAPFNEGRTTTHEVGHYLNLSHIWGDGGCNVDDLVSDTPASDAPNFSCTPNHTSCGSTDMVQNYMDYSDDACMNLFTTGQSNRMRALFATNGARASLLSSTACGNTGGGGGGGGTTSCDAPQNLSVANVTATEAQLSWDAVSGAQTFRLDYRVQGTNSWTTVNSISGNTYALSGLTASTNYQARVRAVCGADVSPWSSTESFTTTAATGGTTCDRPATISANNATASSATVTWAAVSGAQGYRLRYRIVGTSTWTTFNNVTATSYNLTGLVANTDYQVRVQTLCAGGERSNGRTTFFSTLGAPAGDDCTDSYEPNDYFDEATATSPGSAHDKLSMIAGPYDTDWYVFNNTAARPNIRLVLRDLPKDYDLYLFQDGYLVDWSENWYTQTEMITYNTDEIGTYEILVVGYDGAHTADDCYELRVRTRANVFYKNELADKPAARKTAKY